MEQTTDKPELPEGQDRLKAARTEIEAVFKKYNIAGYCTLHTPGCGESFWDIWPSYSVLKGDLPNVRVVSKLEDYGGDAKRQAQDAANTTEMIHAISMGLENHLMFVQLFEFLANAFNAEVETGPVIPAPGGNPNANSDMH